MPAAPSPTPSPALKNILSIIAMLTAAVVAALGTPTGPAPDQPVPPVTAPTTPAPAPNPGKYAACVAPAGMTALIDQDKSDSQSPWRIPAGSDHAEIWFTATPLDAAAITAGWTRDSYLAYVAAGRDVWNASACLDVHVVQLEPGYQVGQDRCPVGKNCVPITVDNGGGDDGNFNDTTSGGFTTGGNIQISRKLSAKTNPAGCSARRNVIVHEMGHAVGLVHRKGRVLMNGDTYDDICTADDAEYRNLLFDYGRQIRR